MTLQGESRVHDESGDGGANGIWHRLRWRKVVQWGIASAAGA